MTLRQVPALSLIVYPNSRLNTLHVFSNYRTLRLLSSLLRLRSRKFCDTHIYYSDRSFIISVTEVTYFCVSPLSRQCSGRVSEWHWQVNWLCSNNVWHAHFPASNAVLAAVFNRTDYCIRTLNTLALLWCLQISWDVHRFKVKHDSATLPADSDYIETDRADRMAMPHHKKIRGK